MILAFWLYMRQKWYQICREIPFDKN
jgi:hypothetical protein